MTLVIKNRHFSIQYQSNVYSYTYECTARKIHLIYSDFHSSFAEQLWPMICCPFKTVCRLMSLHKALLSNYTIFIHDLAHILNFTHLVFMQIFYKLSVRTELAYKNMLNMYVALYSSLFPR